MKSLEDHVGEMSHSGEVPQRHLNGKVSAVLKAASVRGRADVIRCLCRLHAQPLKGAGEGEESQPESEVRFCLDSSVSQPCLMAAAAGGHTDSVVALMEDGGADPKGSDQFGSTALMVASQNGHVRVAFKLLSSGAHVNRKKARDGFTALILAAQKGHVEVVDLLLRWGAEVMAKNGKGVDALMYVSENGHLEVAELLIASGADVHSERPDGGFALLLASQNGFVNLADLLLRSGANPSKSDQAGWTPLTVAARGGHLQTLSLLLDAGADLGAGGGRALHLAVRNGHLEVTARILKALKEKESTPVANVSFSDKIIEIARENGHADVAALLSGLLSDGDVLDSRSRFDWAASEGESWGPLASLLSKQAVALWPLWVLELLLEKEKPVPRRQDMEETLVQLGASEEKVAKAVEVSSQVGAGPFPSRSGYSIVCLSYAWLSKDHPDPDLFHLKRLVKDIRGRWWARGDRADKVVVFWDLMSLFQKPRDETQNELFKEALNDLEILYSSPHTRVCKSTGVPADSIAYALRGWPCFETFITGFKSPRLVLHLSTLEGEDFERESERETVAQSKQSVQMPACPEEFNSVLDTKKFTNGADAEIVKDLYRGFVFRPARSLKHVQLSGRVLLGDAELQSLVDLLRFLRTNTFLPASVESVDLSRTGVTDVGVAALVEELGRMSRLTRLSLRGTAVGPLTVRALREALEMGGMQNLSFIDFGNVRGVSHECVGDLKEACILSQARKKKWLVIWAGGSGLLGQDAQELKKIGVNVSGVCVR
uniref:Uncharacterized protein n=1 Tax=Chromera velia CCMP2878 TaxID=1169474 RepID=A0A0G4F8L8_9ALVE|eukprot:Cvel_15729.t1-p1 / transcript=Cvel_15729.t1 / gene=Cvel_15729 / organism=Chromera_velia_CCMP2878 / gene_product=Ankyrin repeat domain-containing protein 29, putative / transcript_product=Ankyrin repeat domain-containing protein 29, putative / location=Cvel_scaffold1176:33299-35947(-) / protein_length=771 / sequence_SO=supercontig / SO=protein_coding / is_pseudo=false